MSAELQLRNPLVVCANQHCRLQHRIAERQCMPGEQYSLCPRCRDEAFSEQPEPAPVPRPPCGACPHAVSVCEAAHCLKVRR